MSKDTNGRGNIFREVRFQKNQMLIITKLIPSIKDEYAAGTFNTMSTR